MPVKKSAGRILVWCCVLALTVVFVQSVRAAPPSGISWGLLYADEFGGSSVDTQKCRLRSIPGGRCIIVMSTSCGSWRFPIVSATGL
ncbi:MAG: hypothetical protein ABSA77_02885 [Thermoguttaceae bacterium]